MNGVVPSGFGPANTEVEPINPGAVYCTERLAAHDQKTQGSSVADSSNRPVGQKCQASLLVLVFSFVALTLQHLEVRQEARAFRLVDHQEKSICPAPCYNRLSLKGLRVPFGAL
jgi:hypothetical protein